MLNLVLSKLMFFKIIIFIGIPQNKKICIKEV